MKAHHYFLSFMILFFSGTSSYSQDNIYFQGNPVWAISSACQVGFPCIAYETFNYYIDGDTLINSLVYKKMFKKGQGTYQWQSSPPAPEFCTGGYSYEYEIPEMFVRSAGKKVYFRLPSDTAEYFLYDFDLNVGDTLPVTFNNFQSGAYVTAVDSIYTSSGYRKRFSISGETTWSHYLIEGIGHSKGFREPMQVPLECGFDLICFSLNDSSFYPQPGNGCSITTDLEQLKKGMVTQVFPQPFSDRTTILLKKPESGVELNVYNSYGSLVRITKYGPTGKIDFERGTLASGIYFYVLNGDAARTGAGKLIITD